MRERKVGVESVGLEMQSHAKCIAGKSYFRHGEKKKKSLHEVCVCVSVSE